MSTTRRSSRLFSQLSVLWRSAQRAGSLRAAEAVHSHLLKTALLPYLHAELLLSYARSAKPGRSLPARFGDLLDGICPGLEAEPSRWNVLLSVLTRRGLSSLALRTFCLLHKLGFPLCSYALCSALAASGADGAVRMGKQVHAYAVKSGWISAVFVGGALLNLYAKVNELREARHMFDEMPTKNETCVNALLSGYVEAKLWLDSVILVRRMLDLGLAPDGFTLSTLLRMCSEMPAPALGSQLHAYLFRRAEYSEQDVFVQSSLIDMYGKSGLADKARVVFDRVGNHVSRKRDVVLWTSMINAYGRNGRFPDVIATFEDMLNLGIEADEVAFVAVLTACSHTGDVTRGLDYFKAMRNMDKILPLPEHYGCITDLLCKAGELEKAWKLASYMALGKEDGDGTKGIRVYGALLSASKESGNVLIGKLAAERALELDPSNVGIYTELSNLYAKMGMWNEIECLRELLNKKGLKKDVGSSWLEQTKK